MVDLGEQVDFLKFLNLVQFLERTKPYCFWQAIYKRSIPLNAYIVLLLCYCCGAIPET